MRVFLQNGEIGEQDLAALLPASDRAGYKMDVGSPETMEGVEGLSHDYLMEICSGKQYKKNLLIEAKKDPYTLIYTFFLFYST